MKQKKVSRALMVILFSMIFIVAYKTIAYAANVNGSISSANAVIGENVTLTVNLSSNIEIFGFDVYIQYDASKLDFVSGSSDIARVNGENGRIRLYSDDCSSKNVTATLVFKAKEAGSHNVYLTADSSVYDSDVKEMNLIASTGVITATSKAPVSADNNLKDLTVYVEDENGNTTNGWFWPAFNKDTTQYYLNVDGNAKKLAITANANSGTSTVSLNNPELVVGNNNVTITVNAQDGSTKTYVIAVTKAEKATERETESESQTESKNPDETTGGDQNTSNKKVTIGNKTYTITDYNNEMTLPEGYEIVDYDYKGNNIKALKGLGTGLILVAFVDDTSNIKSFVYDETADDFYKFITANVKSAQYVLVDMPSVGENINIPANYTLSSINYDNSVLVAYVSGDSKIYIVSAIDCNGKKGLYYLDSENNTIMRYFENENAINTNTNTNTNNNSDSDELYKVKTQSRIILIISVTIGLVMLGVILALVVSRKNSKDEDLDDEYDDELDEEYDDDEYEEEQEEEYDEDEYEEEYEEEYDEDKYEEEYDEDESEEEQEGEENEEEQEGEENEEEHNEEKDKEEQEADNDKNNAGEEINEENDKSNGKEELNKENKKDEKIVEVEKSDNKSEDDKSTEKAEKVDNADKADNTDNTEPEEPMSNSEKVKELLDDDSTSLKEDELDMVLDELLSDILDGDNK